MDPSSKNWLALFVDEFQLRLLENYAKLGSICTTNSLSAFSHSYLHSSGLFYGYAKNHQLVDYKNSDSWNDADDFKIALTEGLFWSYLVHLDEQRKLNTNNSFDEILGECIQKIYDFYVLFTMNDTQNRKYRSIFSQKIDVKTTIEYILDTRVNNPTMLNLDFWKGSQFNIFAGLDVLYFSLWLQGDYAYDRREEIKREIVTLTKQASSLEKHSLKNGKTLVSYLISSGNFKPETIENIENDVDIDFSICNQKDSYFIRLCLFDFVAFACACDNSLIVNEIIFLTDLARKLNLHEDDTQQSLVTITNFLWIHGEKIFFLQYGEGFDVIKKSFVNRFQAFVQKNRKKIISEVLESKELIELLRKSMNEDLSPEEKAKVREQTLDLLKTIPSLAIFALPGGAIALPILLKILPEEILIPSSFRNKSEEKS